MKGEHVGDRSQARPAGDQPGLQEVEDSEVPDQGEPHRTSATAASAGGGPDHHHVRLTARPQTLGGSDHDLRGPGQSHRAQARQLLDVIGVRVLSRVAAAAPSTDHHGGSPCVARRSTEGRLCHSFESSLETPQPARASRTCASGRSSDLRASTGNPVDLLAVASGPGGPALHDGVRSRSPLRGSPGFAPGSLLPHPPLRRGRVNR